MLSYATIDRDAFNGHVTARLAAYGAEMLRAGEVYDDVTLPVIDNILDLWIAANELQVLTDPAPGSRDEALAAMFVGYAVRRHGLGELPVPAGVIPLAEVGLGYGGVTWNTLPGVPGNLVYGPLYPTSINGFDQRVIDIINSYDFGGIELHADLPDLLIANKPGSPAALANEAWHISPEIKDDIIDLLYPYVQPAVTITLTPSALQRRGDAVTVVADGNYTIGSDSAPTQGVYRKNGTVCVTQTTGIGSPAPGSLTDDTATFSFTAVFPQSGAKTATATIPFASPVFFGVGVPTLTAAQVTALSENLSIHGNALVLPFPAIAVGQVYHIRFPVSWGMPTIIKDANLYVVTPRWNTLNPPSATAYVNGTYTELYAHIRTTVPVAAPGAAQLITLSW